MLPECEQRFNDLERRVADLERRAAVLEKFFSVAAECAGHLVWQDANDMGVDDAK